MTPASQETITEGRLRELLHYDPDTGVFMWRVTRRQMRFGDVAGHIFIGGYRKIKIDGRFYGAHRLAWLWMTGALPKAQIDHINCLRDDNRFENLRQAVVAQNTRNRSVRASKLGPKGAYYSDGHRGKKWQASIRIDGRNKSLGYYQTPNEAHAAYCEAARKFFGEFARGA